VRSESREGIVEEIPEAYKDVDAVIEVVHQAGLAKKAARLRPMGVIKG
jgi:tRNA-splicing ligase RtcB